EVRMAKVLRRAEDIRQRALVTQQRIRRDAAEILEPYLTALRSDIVAESNRIEGYDWSSRQVRELVNAQRELLNAPIGSFMAVLRGDSRVYEALGLYRAHKLADEWAESKQRLREFEIRALHGLVCATEDHGGAYKTESNSIGGVSHKTVEPWDVPRAMGELNGWWQESAVDPALEATVVHAWLTHIHPFKDGNGRIARILANFALIQNDFPPLLIRSGSDRGQYYDALAASDDGDILPLYSLFVSVLRRTVKTMASPGYVRAVVQDRLLTSLQDKFALWSRLPQTFASAMQTELAKRGYRAEVQGYPDLSSFALLTQRDADGNSWYLKVLDGAGRPKWLLWYGYKSQELIDITGPGVQYPSIFVSRRTSDPYSEHPYTPVFYDDSIPNELLLRPLEKKPARLRQGYEVGDYTIDAAAEKLASSLYSRDNISD
ncbi:Fic family protein, partial [Micromonospora sp. II]